MVAQPWKRGTLALYHRVCMPAAITVLTENNVLNAS